MWEHTGGDEKNDVKHVDLVLIDQKGDAIYAEIPPNAIPACKPHLEEGKIVYMTKITVERTKQYYKVVDHPYMIRLNKFTLIREADNYPENFPKYTFSLTPFTNLPQYLSSKEKFLDVIGKIVAVSNAANVYSSSGNIMKRRIVRLQDLSGNIVDVSLGGKRALEFDGDEVLRVGQQHHVIAIFVGTLMKLYKKNLQFLSATSASRWYINENDIPEIKDFQKRLPATTEPIQELFLQNEDETKQSFEKKTLLQLKDIDPFTEKDNKYECTVTITGVTEKKPWCYRACTVDNHNMRLQDNAFTCTKEGCTNTRFDWKYKIPFIATDGTYTLEFMVFDKRGIELLGKNAEILRKQYDFMHTPPEVLTYVGHKFTFIVKVLYRSIDAPEPSFEVVLIKEKFGKEAFFPKLQSSQVLSTGSSSGTSGTYENLPLLVPIASKKIEHQVLQPIKETESMDLDQQSGDNKEELEDDTPRLKKLRSQ